MRCQIDKWFEILKYKINIKKTIVVLLVNILLTLSILFFADVYFLYNNEQVNFNSFKDFCRYYKFFYSSMLLNRDDNYLKAKYIDGIQIYRPNVNEDSKLKPILLFGCSFAYGYNIPFETTFSEELGRYTKRPIYNRALNGASPSLMLYQLSNEEFYKTIPQPEYVIYTYIADQACRMFVPCSPIYPKDDYDLY